MVVDENPLRVWFQPNELELLICGSEVTKVAFIA